MKTARFVDLVSQCGKPHSHLLLVAPAKDGALQAAIRANRVLTVHQEHVGKHQDHGEVGFAEDAHAQYLVFPRSLAPFAGKKIVGINYDLLAAPPAQPAAAPRRTSPARRASHPRFKFSPSSTPTPPAHAESATAPSAPPPIALDAALRREIRLALQELRDGKTVAAYERLQTALRDER